ncbi:MAG: bifunctional glutamate N-acetyltransferase/amino-acid acetyltransferase ArgJ [Treponemataceae bacterium]|nr:MAG: bifunctional glutamate N-acetyltransferase/amino-acid acetyltransferase ArgJ [Treponemataceae bacterium]
MGFDMMDFTEGGVCAPQGFVASAVLCGIKKGRVKPDTALIFSEKPCAAAGVFTKNQVKAECVKVTASHLESLTAQAVIVNSGNANACTGAQGIANAQRMAAAAARELGIVSKEVLVASTGVIGVQLPIEKIEAHAKELSSALAKNGNEAAREAILTTDTVYKECAVRFSVGNKTVTIGTMAKGSGMIHVNMGTMLGFITTDCAISGEMLQRALRASADDTYNCVSVDGDTSTNDSLLIMANGMAGNAPITTAGADFDAFLAALNALNTVMAKKIAADGEGAEHLIECVVSGARTVGEARALAKSVVSSSLVKAAFFGRDANWGRVLCALGYSGVAFTIERTSVAFKNGAGEIGLYQNGVPLDFDEVSAKRILSEKETQIVVTMHDGDAEGYAWGCDLTYDYVKINGDYRT